MLLLLHMLKYIMWKKQQINTILTQTSDLRGSLASTAQNANQPHGTAELQGGGGLKLPKNSTTSLMNFFGT